MKVAWRMLEDREAGRMWEGRRARGHSVLIKGYNVSVAKEN